MCCCCLLGCGEYRRLLQNVTGSADEAASEGDQPAGGLQWGTSFGNALQPSLGLSWGQTLARHSQVSLLLTDGQLLQHFFICTGT